MKIFKERIFTYYFILFIAFTVVVLLFQYNREKDFRKSQLEILLDNVSGTVQKYLETVSATATVPGTAEPATGRAKGTVTGTETDTGAAAMPGGRSLSGYDTLDYIIAMLPVDNIRITLIAHDGMVLYDSSVEEYDAMENHSARPEIIEALSSGTGSSIRRSASTGKEYFYYAKDFNTYLVRSATEYTFEIKSFLRINKLFLIFIFVLFFLVWGALIYINDRMGIAIGSLRDFAASAAGNRDPGRIDFPETELGLIGLQLSDIYRDLKKTRDQLILEKEKIFRHLQTMEEGVAIFSSDRRMILSNRSFLQYASLVADFELGSPEDIFRVGAVTALLEDTGDGDDDENEDDRTGSSSREVTMLVHNRYINIRCNVFKDNTFEIVIKDITKSEKNRVLKQQLTSNIAHELRTPLTAILGYLETLLSSEDIDLVTQRQFLGRTRDQADRLAELLDHIAVLNKLEEGAGFYGLESIKVRNIVDEVTDSLRMRIEENGAIVDIDVPENVIVRGNTVLLNSIFQNLFDNTLNYAGNNVFISLSMYFEDDSFYHFRYSNDGRSVDEKHLSRLFERFYRVDKGRSRKMGGSGLGLAIVKHAVQFHRGDITAKNRPGGGLEFLFSLAKNLK